MARRAKSGRGNKADGAIEGGGGVIVEDVGHDGAAEAIDGLVVVAHTAQVAVGLGQLMEPAVLDVVGVGGGPVPDRKPGGGSPHKKYNPLETFKTQIQDSKLNPKKIYHTELAKELLF